MSSRPAYTSTTARSGLHTLPTNTPGEISKPTLHDNLVAVVEKGDSSIMDVDNRILNHSNKDVTSSTDHTFALQLQQMQSTLQTTDLTNSELEFMGLPWRWGGGGQMSFSSFWGAVLLRTENVKCQAMAGVDDGALFSCCNNESEAREISRNRWFADPCSNPNTEIRNWPLRRDRDWMFHVVTRVRL